MKKYNVFISHGWEYDEQYNKVEDWLDEAYSKCLLVWDNYSVPLLDTDLNPRSSIGKKKLQEKINNQIAQASIVLILSGMYTAHPYWIEYEVLKAANYGKYIIGVEPWKQESTPKVVSDYADIMVEWNKSSVTKAMLESLTHNMITSCVTLNS